VKLTRKALKRILLVAVLVLPVVLTFSFFQIKWRVQFVIMKVTGAAGDIPWRDVYLLILPASLRGSSEQASAIQREVDLAGSDPEAEAGAVLFNEQCAQCHGLGGRGGMGPNLSRGQFQRGGTDSDLFRVIRDGIPGTSMTPRDLSEQSVRQLIAYIRHQIETEASSAEVRAFPSPFDVRPQHLLQANARLSEWLTYSGSYDGHRYRDLNRIRRETVERLRLKWVFQLPVTAMKPARTTPLVVGHAMFVTMPPNRVWALDARTGKQIWSWSGKPPTTVKASDVVHRGVAIAGNTLVLGTIDARLVALNAQTGQLLWEVEVASSEKGYSITTAPLVVGDRVIVGVAGGEFGIRGFLDAYSVTSGRRLWRFYTVPGPGERGHETWGTGRAWRTGGAPTWLTGSYDPDLNLVYWGTGNPAPDFQGDFRPGDNLYSSSVIAIDPISGKLRWYFQFTPHDENDWDAAQIPVLADAVLDGRTRRLMFWANRNGFYYVLDRESGAFLRAREFAHQTWALGIDSTGRPIRRPGAAPTIAGTLVAPAVHGATNWWSPSYNPTTGTFYVPVMTGAAWYKKSAPVRQPHGSFYGSAGLLDTNEPVRAGIRAMEALTGSPKWEYWFPPRAGELVMAGLLTTSGGLVFGGDQDRLVALDSDTGRELWHFNVGGTLGAAPITYLMDGRQHITVAAGRAILTFALERE
jgi:alcohol dehydrogenase (cytochrome c)